ncbi:hypothetical protein JB92DRAFT_2633518, partial [Gautieria morchelliformis]
LPNIIGRYFPRRDDAEVEDFYCASMLALLKPWRSLHSLKSNLITWWQAFDTFHEAALERMRDIIANIQYNYDCEDAVSNEQDSSRGEAGNNDCEIRGQRGSEEEESDMDLEE